jgi:hypothetical protein
MKASITHTTQYVCTFYVVLKANSHYFPISVHHSPTSLMEANFFYTDLVPAYINTFRKTVYQYSETNVMHVLFNLLRIKGIYMFRALLAHPQEAVHKRHGILCDCYVSWLHQSWCSQLTKHAHNIPSAVCVAPPEDEHVMLETCRGP